MTEEAGGSSELTTPALLRAARGTYGSAIDRALSEADCDDMPRNGSFVISAILRTGAPLGSIIEALVVRGYLVRAVDPEDRRRLTISLTERGKAAAQAIRAAVVEVDAELERRVGPESVAQARTVLYALMAVGRDSAA